MSYQHYDPDDFIDYLAEQDRLEQLRFRGVEEEEFLQPDVDAVVRAVVEPMARKIVMELANDAEVVESLRIKAKQAMLTANIGVTEQRRY